MDRPRFKACRLMIKIHCEVSTGCMYVYIVAIKAGSVLIGALLRCILNKARTCVTEIIFVSVCVPIYL